VGVVIQTRMGSTRLPGKALVDLAGLPLIERLVRRVAASRLPLGMLVATSVAAADDAIVAMAARLRVPVVRGPEQDLLARLSAACDFHRLEAFVRVTGDNPLTDPDGVDALVEAWRAAPCDYLSTVHPDGYALGTGAELITRAALARAEAALTALEWRARVTTWIRTSGRFECRRVSAPPACRASDCFLTVDWPEDVEVLSHVYRRFDGRDDVPLPEILAFLRERPEVRALNAHRHVPPTD
jgi:spore coat polysaccharide biosynthesis protein SpsF (cytidylyltransferase family)